MIRSVPFKKKVCSIVIFNNSSKQSSVSSVGRARYFESKCVHVFMSNIQREFFREIWQIISIGRDQACAIANLVSVAASVPIVKRISLPRQHLSVCCMVKGRHHVPFFSHSSHTTATSTVIWLNCAQLVF